MNTRLSDLLTLQAEKRPEAPAFVFRAQTTTYGALEQASNLCGHFGLTTGCRRIALAGGVALNCTANGRLLRSGLFDELYVQPATMAPPSAQHCTAPRK